MLFKAEKDKLKDVWMNPKSFGTVLFITMADAYGNLDFLDYEPMTVRLEINDLFGLENPPQNNLDKLYAIMNLYSNNLFYTSPEQMIHIANALSCNWEAGINMELFDPATVLELDWALSEAALHDPPKNNKEWEARFSHEVKTLIGVTLDWEGFDQTFDLLYVGELPKTSQTGSNSVIRDPSDQDTNPETIKTLVKSRMRQLFSDLNELPLKNIDKKEWQKYFEEIANNLGIKTLV